MYVYMFGIYIFYFWGIDFFYLYFGSIVIELVQERLIFLFGMGIGFKNDFFGI